MPDLPDPKRKYRPRGPDGRGPAPGGRRDVRYAELRCRTNFSFLEGASHPDELVQRGAELGLAALAITDCNTLAGVVRAHVAAKDLGLKLLIGAEITPADAPPLVLLATDRAAYGRLARLITVGRRRAPKGECHLTFDEIAAHAAGLLAGVVLDAGCRVGCAHRSAADVVGTAHPTDAHRLWLYREVFGDRCYALAELHCGPNDRQWLARVQSAAWQAKVPVAAANGAFHHAPERRFLQDVLTAIRHGCTVAELGDRMFPNAERHLKSPAQMAALFAGDPAAIERTVEIAGRCTFTLDELRYEYPEELCPPGMTPLDHLARLTWAGARERYPRGVPEKVRGLIEHELVLIEELRYEAYFLTVWDLVRFARSRGILCQGRGSAANSAVCYCLGVTSVDPDRIDVLFERFVSRERNESPDIDVDFEHERREEVLQYVYDKYGRERAGMTAEVITYRPRSAVRDVGKALGLSLEEVDVLAKSLEHYHDNDRLAVRFREAGFDPTTRTGRQLIALVREILGFPRHLSQHVGGMVIARGPLCELVPIENAAMAGRTVIQWDKDDLDALGMLKVDCLSLGMLTAIRKCFDLIAAPSASVGRIFNPSENAVSRTLATSGTLDITDGLKIRPTGDEGSRKVTLADIPPEDPAVYEMIQRADTMGVFQIESRAQMSMLPRMLPRCFYDLVIEVAIVRPGPIQGDMVHPYLRRRCGAEPVAYPDERIKAVLERTLGVPLFQEQAMRLAVVAAGFTPGEADQLRRAMGAWRRSGVIDKFRQKLIGGMQANGYATGFAERLYRQIQGFGEYGFPESHAASFALLVYVSAWLKRHHPAAFAAALLNSQPMGFYAPAQLVGDAAKHGVEVRPIDVNASAWDCTLESSRHTPCAVADGTRSVPAAFSLRLGLRLVRGLSRGEAEGIVKCRGERPFRSFEDCARRTGLASAVLAKLSQADVFGSLGLNRRGALWQSLPEQKVLPLFAEVEATTPAESPPVALPAMSPLQEVIADYRSAGLSLKDHPVKFIRPRLQELRAVRAAELATLPDGRRLRVAGLVLLRQRPGTAKGITFVTLEDETGTANLIIRPDVWERFHHAARTATLLLARGVLQHQNEVIHVLADQLEDLSPLLVDVPARSRDFR